MTCALHVAPNTCSALVGAVCINDMHVADLKERCRTHGQEHDTELLAVLKDCNAITIHICLFSLSVFVTCKRPLHVLFSNTGLTAGHALAHVMVMVTLIAAAIAIAIAIAIVVVIAN